MRSSTLKIFGMGLLASFIMVGPAQALDFDFTDLGVDGTNLGTSVTTNGVTADGFNDDGGGNDPADLWLRNVPNDNGLGVCSEGNAACVAGGGDVNEISNQEDGVFEMIRLSHNVEDGLWTSLWLSSLDNNAGDDTIGLESATIAWSNNADPDQVFANSAVVGFGVFGAAVEGDVLPHLPGFDASAAYIFLLTDSTIGSEINNDYLVWKGSVAPIPEPTTVALFGTGLLALGGMRLYKGRKQSDK